MEVNAGMAGVVLYLAAAIFPNTIMAGKLDRVIESGRVEITDLEGLEYKHLSGSDYLLKPVHLRSR